MPKFQFEGPNREFIKQLVLFKLHWSQVYFPKVQGKFLEKCRIRFLC